MKTKKFKVKFLFTYDRKCFCSAVLPLGRQLWGRIRGTKKSAAADFIALADRLGIPRENYEFKDATK